MTNQIVGELKSAEEAKAVFDEFESQEIQYGSIEHIINASPDEVKKLDSEECGEYATQLSQFSFSLQRLNNRLGSQIKWAEWKLDAIMSGNIQQIKGYGLKEKMLHLFNIDQNASNINTYKCMLEARQARLYGLTHRLDSLTNSFIELQRSRRRYNA